PPEIPETPGSRRVPRDHRCCRLSEESAAWPVASAPGGSGGGGGGLRKRAQSLASTMFNLQDLQAVNKAAGTLRCSARWGGLNAGRCRCKRLEPSVIAAVGGLSSMARLRYTQASTAIQSIQEETFGQLNFSLDFRDETGILTVRVIQAIELQPKDGSSGQMNPYCRVAVLPNRKSQTTTKIHKRTLNPEFEEEFIFELKQQDINWSVLEITVFDYDPCSLDDCLGQVKLPLAEVDLSEKQVMWKGICSMEKDPDPEHTVGDLMFSMSYLPSAKRLSVSIMKARNLREAHKDKPLSDALVRVTLSTQHGKKQKKKKTSTCKSPNGNPSWEEALTFTGISEEDLAGGYLELVVCHDGVLTSTEVSRVYLGPDTSGEEYQHWWNMVKSKGAAAQWHKLHPVGQQKVRCCSWCACGGCIAASDMDVDIVGAAAAFAAGVADAAVGSADVVAIVGTVVDFVVPRRCAGSVDGGRASDFEAHRRCSGLRAVVVADQNLKAVLLPGLGVQQLLQVDLPADGIDAERQRLLWRLRAAQAVAEVPGGSVVPVDGAGAVQQGVQRGVLLDLCGEGDRQVAARQRRLALVAGLHQQGKAFAQHGGGAVALLLEVELADGAQDGDSRAGVLAKAGRIGEDLFVQDKQRRMAQQGVPDGAVASGVRVDGERQAQSLGLSCSRSRHRCTRADAGNSGALSLTSPTLTMRSSRRMSEPAGPAGLKVALQLAGAAAPAVTNGLAVEPLGEGQLAAGGVEGESTARVDAAAGEQLELGRQLAVREVVLVSTELTGLDLAGLWHLLLFLLVCFGAAAVPSWRQPAIKEVANQAWDENDEWLPP
uniref:C2 domain-containing protein n=1 Tax=Macrostomum lignano TaxID=282301 RepID=A0A1I8IRK6_9PLAT